MKKSKRNIDKIAKEVHDVCIPPGPHTVPFETTDDGVKTFYRKIAKWHLDQMEKLYGQRTVWE